jgi:O-antigen ligase
MLHRFSLISKKQSSRILYAAYCILIFTQIFSFRTAGIGPSQREMYIDQASIIRISVIAFILLLLIFLFLLKALPSFSAFGMASSQKAILLYIFFMGISSLWSPLRLTAVFRILQLTVSTLLIWYMILSWDKNKLSDLGWILSFPILIVGIVNGLFAPGKIEIYQAGFIDYFYRFKDNAAGHVAAIAIAFNLIQITWNSSPLPQWKTLLRLLLAIGCLFLFRSATGFFLMLLAVTIILVRRRAIPLVFLLLSTLVISIIFFDPLQITSFLLGGKNPQNILTFTGRLDLYPIAIKFGLQSPIWGYGFLGDSLLTRFDYMIGWIPQNAHSGFLSSFLNFGIIGLLVLIITFIY